ncbi:glycosyltransferase [Candidatus Uhrbacteria bacterium]|nr:glycosyltransferase [Candidatus Uhrbacteria bacterium]
MRILIIASLFRPYSRGGAEVVVGTIVNELKKKHDVSVLTVEPWGGVSSWKWKTSKEDGITVNRFAPLNIFSFIHINAYPCVLRLVWHFFDTFNIHSYVLIRRILTREKPDCILTHNLKGIGLLTPHAIKKSKTFWLHTAHDVALRVPSGLLMYGKERQQWFFNTLATGIHRFLFGSPDVVLFPSTFLKNFYYQYGFFSQSKKVVLSNPLPHWFLGRRHENSMDETRPFLFVGQLEEHKGIRLLLRSFQNLNDQNARLVIVGGGSLESFVRDAMKTDLRIMYRGTIPNREVAQELGRAYFSVLPTLCYENSPMIILESLSCGTPCIVSNIGGCAEHIRESVSGFIVPPNDMSALTDAFRKALALTDMDYDECSNAARKTIQRLFTCDYFSTLEEIIKSKKRA